MIYLSKICLKKSILLLRCSLQTCLVSRLIKIKKLAVLEKSFCILTGMRKSLRDRILRRKVSNKFAATPFGVSELNLEAADQRAERRFKKMYNEKILDFGSAL